MSNDAVIIIICENQQHTHHTDLALLTISSS